MKKQVHLSQEEQVRILKEIGRSQDFIRGIAKETMAGSTMISRSLKGYSVAEKSVIYIILESISETPIRFSGPRKGMVLVFREWSISKDDLIIKTNNLTASTRAVGLDLQQWFESFLCP